jgi:hypothetical protein
MFGIKKLQAQVKELKTDIQYIKKETDRTQNVNLEYFKIMLDQLAHQKLDLSKINGRFHDLGEKFDKSQKYIEILAEESNKNCQISRELLDKIVTNDAILLHVKELNEKLTFLFDYMKQLEKLLGNVDIIVDQCLPEKTLKLPKKKKTS